MSGLVRVDYAGPGGTCEGMRMLGLEPVGVEWDAAACATRAAAGHLTIRADLATYRPHHEPGSVWGYWASPPCQTFSTAGKGAGRDQIDGLVSVIDREDWAAADTLDPRTRHVVDAARTAVELHPEWVCMEQVPPAQPVFEAIARRLRVHGYSVWVGVLNCADYGIPQTRKRVILMASRVRAAHPPEPTHSADPVDGLFGTTERWVSMADALGWPTSFEVKGRRGAGMTERHGDREAIPATEPYPTVTGGAHRRHWVVDRRQEHGPKGARVPVPAVPVSEPAPTVTGLAGGQWIIREGEPVPVLVNRRDSDAWIEAEGERRNRPISESAPTITGEAHRWEFVNGSQDHATRRPLTAPAPAILASADNGDSRFQPIGWPHHQPATTVAGDPRITARCHHEAGSQGSDAIAAIDVAAGADPGARPIKLTVEDALILQSFRSDYPVQGTKTKKFEQVGNAVPPVLSMKVVGAITGAAS